ncbi:MAG: hypothetical protein LBM61_02835 [Prevotellaceae bacterium]|nr:hypothetical protein [Prevotellaceae bacterium]
MLITLVLTLLIVAICLLLLAINIVMKPGGKFPNTHISGSKALRDRGITCVQSQDRAAQTT